MKIKFILIFLNIFILINPCFAKSNYANINSHQANISEMKYKNKSLYIIDKEKKIELIDIPNITLDNTESGIERINLQTGSVKVVHCDIAIIGGSIGGIAAGLAAGTFYNTRQNHKTPKIIIIEETSHLGGQMTAQGVSALDENYLVETSGACRNYQKLRNNIRKYYQNNTNLIDSKKIDPILNPGNSWVTRLSFEPRVAEQMIINTLKPLTDKNILTYKFRSKSLYGRTQSGKIVFSSNEYTGNALRSDNKIKGIGFYDFTNKEIFEIQAKKFIDATELGDLLNLFSIPYVSGAESKTQTLEVNAETQSNQEQTQDFTYPFVVEYIKDGKFIINKPDCYEKFNGQKKYSFLNYKMFESVKLNDDSELLPFWEYRRLIDKNYFMGSSYTNDLAMINWDSNDLRNENIIDKSPQIMAQKLRLSKCLSLGFLYWLQTAAPRDDGGYGYGELKLRYDIFDTKDGLSSYPYIRESRRIIAKQTIKEMDISASFNPGPRARLFSDAVGIGLYPIDIHGDKSITELNSNTKPFQIPLGSLIPKNGGNLLAGCKNIGTTHITNGSYRLHPIEWAIGTACGVTAYQSIKTRKSFSQILKSTKQVLKIQSELINQGNPVFWFDDVGTNNPYFKYVQFLAVTELINNKTSTNLSFNGYSTLTFKDILPPLCRALIFKKHKNKFQKEINDFNLNILKNNPESNALNFLVKHKILNKNITYNLNDLVTYNTITKIPIGKTVDSPQPINKFEFAKWLFEICQN